MLDLHDCICSEEDGAKYKHDTEDDDVLDDELEELARADRLLSDVQVVLILALVAEDALVEDDPRGQAVGVDAELLLLDTDAFTRAHPLVGDLDVLQDRGLDLEFRLHLLEQRSHCSSSHVVHLLFIAVEEERLLAHAKLAQLILFVLVVARERERLPTANLLVGLGLLLLLADALTLLLWCYVVEGGVL